MTVQKDPEGNETRHLLKFADFQDKRTLEVGCGEGRLTWRYASASSMTVGLDPEKDALHVARIDRPSDLVDRVQFANSQAEHLPFHKETFDIAVLAWSL